ncbi:GTPase [Leptotrichia sp. oral taxon 212]|mgnify:FL=1|jgi:rho-related protein racO|uniref:GTPase n=1 Tax=Leptotrichia sp. oral taxon 212 TaxID=712357 RepID=UPI0006A94E3E|nr:GTPase [Leptotrichia sp. oral taxon 212]ALA96228.1 GTPase [Leptotrichia sp. oral taxon 212]
MKQINGKRAVLENGVLRKEVKFGFSMAAFLLGFIYPLIKGDYITAGIAFVVIGTAGMMFFPLVFVLSMVFGFIYNKMYVRRLIKQGWHPFTEEDAQVLKKNGILFNDKNKSYGSNEERTIEEAENFKKQESGKIEVIEFKKNNNDNDFYDTNNANIDSSFNGNPNNTEMNHKNRTIQKFVARSIGGGLVSLILGVFTANIVLILLGAGLTGGGAFLAVKNKDKIKWK